MNEMVRAHDGARAPVAISRFVRESAMQLDPLMPAIETQIPAYFYAFQPAHFASRSGIHLLAEYMGSSAQFFDVRMKHVMTSHWTPAAMRRRFGVWYSGSTWHSTRPLFDEWMFARSIRKREDSVAHFIYGEFAIPMFPAMFHRRGARVVATYHASASRLDEVLGNVRCFERADGITLMSSSQVPFFLDRGYPEERLRVILHGVDTDHFRPLTSRTENDERPLDCLLIGNMGRDHAFVAEVLRKLPAGVLQLNVATAQRFRGSYCDTPHLTMLDRLTDEELLQRYQCADLLLMPMQNCAANNVFLESMACGTPIMTNRVGGTPDYVPEECSILMDRKNVDEWVDRLVDLAKNRSLLRTWRSEARKRAEELAWPTVATRFQEFYREIIDQGR